MKYFVIFSMIIFLAVMFYIDILRYFISPSYFSGLKVVPIVMVAEFFFGIFFNLSLWYKLTDKTAYGMWFSLLGLAITVALNVLLVPRYGYMGCAWASFACYGTMMAVSYAFGRVKFPIGYCVSRLAFYFLSAIAVWVFSELIAIECKPWLNMIIRTPLLLGYALMAMKIEGITLRDLIPRRHA